MCHATFPYSWDCWFGAFYISIWRKASLSSGFNALEFWGWVDTFKPTWYSAVPTIHQTLLARAEHNQAVILANRFRFIRSSSSSLLPVFWNEWKQHFKHLCWKHTV